MLTCSRYPSFPSTSFASLNLTPVTLPTLSFASICSPLSPRLIYSCRDIQSINNRLMEVEAKLRAMENGADARKASNVTEPWERKLPYEALLTRQEGASQSSFLLSTVRWRDDAKVSDLCVMRFRRSSLHTELHSLASGKSQKKKKKCQTWKDRLLSGQLASHQHRLRDSVLRMMNVCRDPLSDLFSR